MITVSSLDLETTGFNAHEGHRITEIAIIVSKYNPADKSFTNVGKFHKLVNPKRTIPENIQKLTNITPDLLKDCPTWEELAPSVGKIIRATDLFVAHNVEFDSVFLAHELMRVGETLSPHTQTFCTMENGRFATPMGKLPKLIELCHALGVEFKPEDAHRAIYDTEKMQLALVSGIERGYYDLSLVIEQINRHKLLKKAAA